MILVCEVAIVFSTRYLMEKEKCLLLLLVLMIRLTVEHYVEYKLVIGKEMQ